MAVRGLAPRSREELAAALGAAAAAGEPVRIAGGGTKPWGAPGAEPAVELSTARLDRVLDHNAGDLTLVLEAGVPLSAAQERVAEAGQLLPLDPPADAATVGGVLATADSGPLRARFGGARDLVLGMTVALSDGTLAKSGGRVIKNVAGYDLGKLFTGAHGTLGAVVAVALRLQPLPGATATAAGGASDPEAVGRASCALAHAPLQPLALDVRWSGGDGAVLARFGGAEAAVQAEAALAVLRAGGLDGALVVDDDAIWRCQREGQRSPGGVVVKVSGLPAQLPAVLRAATEVGARVVGRAGLGLSWLALERRPSEQAASAVERLRRALRPSRCVVLDAPPELRARVDPWGPIDPATLDLMRRVKQRFDPAGVCNPGIFAGGI